MYILMINRGIPTKDDPQWGCFEKDQAEGLAKLGHKVVCISHDCRFRMKWRKHGMTIVKNNNVIYYHYYLMPTKWLTKINRSLSNKFKCSVIDKLYRHTVKDNGKPDIIYSQFFSNTYLGAKLKLKYKCPLVGIEHLSRFSLNSDIQIHPADKRKAAWAFSVADKIISVSEGLRRGLKHLFGIETTVVHNMVGEEFLVPVVETTGNGKFTFVTTGSLIHRKGFDLIIKACEKLNIPRDKWQVKIIGRGELYDQLNRQISDSGLQDNIALLGSKAKTEIVDILQHSDAFILASRNENFSVAVLEALVTGLPMVATLCGGTDECIDKSNGILIPVENVNALSEAMQKLYENRDSYNRKLIAEKARARFAPEVIAKELTAVFESVVNKNKTVK